MPRTSTKTYLLNAMRHEGFSDNLDGASEQRTLLATMHYDVWRETQQLTRILQLQVSKSGARYVTYTPIHAIEDLLVEYFMLANQESVIVLESHRGTFVGAKRMMRRYDIPLREVLFRIDEMGASAQELLDLAPVEIVSSV